jgi:hypothetical protein
MKTCLLSLLIALTFATPTRAQLPLGAATGSRVSCPSNAGSTPGTCYEVTVTSCPNPAYAPTATLKVVSPSGPPKGTVVMTGTYGGAGFEYSHTFTYGPLIVSGLASAGFTAVETSFNGEYGWMSYGSVGGPAIDACVYGTVVQWIYQNIHLAGATKPMCATGVSGGSSAIAYMLSFYGFGTSVSQVFFSMAELTSGPPFGRIDLGCSGLAPSILTSACKLTASQTYDAAADGLLDSAFGDSGCSQHSSAESTIWLNGSNAAPDAIYSFPSTDVHVLMGGKDRGVAPSLGQYWFSKVQAKGKCSVGCVKDADHLMPNTLDAAQQILSDLTTYCKLQR